MVGEIEGVVQGPKPSRKAGVFVGLHAHWGQDIVVSVPCFIQRLRLAADAARQAEELVLAGVEHFMRELRVLDAVGTVTDVRTHVDQLREEQLQKALKQLQNGADPEKILRQFAHTYSNKLLHGPTVMLRRAAAEGRMEVFDWTRELFQLPHAGRNHSDNN